MPQLLFYASVCIYTKLIYIISFSFSFLFLFSFSFSLFSHDRRSPIRIVSSLSVV